MKSRSKDIIILLGAGASVDANIPSSPMMINSIELLLKSEGWVKFQGLYNQIKSAIYYSAGLKGRFGPEVDYNIERLVNTLYELERNEDHPLYPFVSNWNTRLLDVVGKDFVNVREFRHKILEALQSWVQPEDASDAEYFPGLKLLQRELQFSLKIFSLNYDLCVERLAGENFRVQTGFNGVGKQHRWEWKRFDESDPQFEGAEILLYKMHGSINWKRDGETGNLICVNYSGSNIRPSEMQIIFGRDFKLEAADPYLFYAFEFRRCSLEARVIVSIGYSFSDEHINKMVTQAFRADANKRLVVVGNIADTEAAHKRTEEIANKLDIASTSIAVLQGTAKSFLKSPDLVEQITRHLPDEAQTEF